MADRLKQLELVGRGGCAEVYRGTLTGERGTSRRVAIKRLRPDVGNDRHHVEMFVTEARIAVQLGHPAIISGIEFARDDGGYYLVCEWIDGPNLNQLQDAVGPISAAAVGAIGESLADALCYLHDLRDHSGANLELVHRDITPGNVYVTLAGQPKLGDFGAACWRDTGAATPTATVGTRGFAAPEQSRGAWGPQSDIYGLGATLKAVAANLPAPLETVLDRATAMEPEDRYESAQSFREALGGAMREVGGPLDRPGLAELVADTGATRAANPPSLDGALKSILGGAIAIDEPTPGPTVPIAPTASRSTRRRAVLAAIGVAAIATAFGLTHIPDAALDVEMAAPEPSRVTATATVEAADSNTSRSEPAVPGEGTVQKAAKAAPPRKLPPRRFGTVNLNAVPWARVHIDGRELGNTPLRAVELAAGSHQVRLEHSETSQTQSFTIEVDADRVQTFVMDLRQGTVSKRVSP